ncbi:MAG: ATP-dependent helicase [Tissierellia bacterium]|nr:ATP-dependent helicase [Tissierellia bacterium]
MNLTPQQEQAILHVQGPALVLAVPGAGKTTVLLHRIQNLIEHNGVAPDQILSITFSKAQAMDMQQRFFLRQDPDLMKSGQPSFSTIHAFAYQILRTYNREQNRHLELIEGSSDYNKYALIRSLYYRMHHSYITDDTLETFFTELSYIKNTMLSLDDYLKLFQPEVKGFRDLVLQYEGFKKQRHFIDFDDMLTLSLEIIQQDDALLARIRRAYPFIQVDEGQDTSKIQLELISLLAEPNNNLFIVADDDQSIYGFRGARPEELLRFKEKYPEGTLFFMEENHRSYKDIVMVSNAFIRGNKHRYEKKIHTKKEKLKPIEIVSCKNANVQTAYLVERMKQERKDPQRKIAILYRNNVSGMALFGAFEAAGIPYYLRDAKRTYLSHFVLEDILNLLFFARDPSDLELFEKIYYKLNAFLKKDYLGFLRSTNYAENIFDRLLEIPYLKEYQIERILRLKHSFQFLAKLSIPDAIEYIEQELGYGAYLEERIRRSGTGGDPVDVILENLKLLAHGMKEPAELLERLEQLRNQRSFPSPDAVTLSTIHSAKGLEYDSVYMIDLVDGEFPSQHSCKMDPRGDSMAQEEERRLFYVGMTRAKSSLTLISLKTRNGKKVQSSRFFEEVRRMNKKKQR